LALKCQFNVLANEAAEHFEQVFDQCIEVEDFAIHY